MLTKRTLRELLLTSLMCLGIASPTLFAQINHEGMPLNWEENIPVLIDWQTFDAPNLTTLQEEDKATAKFKDAPWRFGIEHDVLWNSLEEGIWTQEQGFDVWRLGVRADLTKSWSFHLSQFDIPKGGVLFVWNEDRSAFLGSFNHENMKKWGGFAIGLIEGEGAVLEYHQPQTLDTKPTIEIAQVVQGYRSLLIRQNELLLVKSSQGPFGNSGACNINVNCPEGADWQIEKKAVALIVNGGFAACTGSLVNNTANDGTPYFLTANHCLGNPNTWTYYFNHESSTCSGSTGPTDNSISGGSLLVSDGGSDVALIQLSEPPPASWNIEYAGWDASGATPENATGIHHPSGDVKKICFEENSPYASSTGGAQVWWIDAWEAGVTEPGSSGSPLFDQNHRIIGQLYGGAAACAGSVNNGAYDFYGRFNISWNLGLSEYLDPQNSGVLVLDGYPTGFDTDYGCTSADACNYSPLAIFDDGSCAVDDECGVCGGDNSSCGGCTDPSACNYEASAIVDDGSCVLDGVTIYFSLLTDNYPAETTWNISDSDGDIVLEGGPYSQTQTTFETSTCIPSGCYTLTVNDSWGDGLQYNGTVGNYILTDSEGNVLAEMIEGGNFGFQANHDFCVESGSPDIPGCTELSSCNFDPEATVDDGSCVDPIELVFEDMDGDGIGGTVGIADICAPLGPNLSLETGDCDDDDATIYPGAPGTGEGVDNNCDGVIDDEEAADGCLGDLNQDGAVTVADILAMLAAFGCLTDCMGDVDGDGSVTVQDLLVLLGEFGSTCFTTCGDPVSHEGYNYSTVLIGDQCWFSENCRYLPEVSNSSSGNSTDPFYYVYGYEGTDVAAATSTSNYDTYGVLYNWPAVMTEGICPSGWHIPSEAEWQTLEMELGMSSAEVLSTGWRGTDEGAQLKSTLGWNSAGNGSNSSGFTGLPGGYRLTGGFNVSGSSSYWWSSSESGSSSWVRVLDYDYDQVYRYNGGTNLHLGFSARCIKD